MRNTKVYSITMPPEMGRQAERLAKRESRTMSELMREAFRRYQVETAQAELLADPQRARHLEELKQAVAQLRKEAVASGASKMTERQITGLVKDARKDRRKRIKSPAR